MPCVSATQQSILFGHLLQVSGWNNINEKRNVKTDNSYVKEKQVLLPEN